MKLILKENVDNLGHIGDIVKVAPGYARNFLLPKGFAIEATEKNAKALEHAKRHLEYKKNKVLEAAKQLAAKIEGLSLSIAHQAGADDRLFGAVTNMELAEQLKANGIEVDRKRIVLAEPIKQLGDFTATVKIHPEVSATLKVAVTKA
uniref:Large ribosomal subunit protein bL9 n=1 Tax=Geobacter sp. (strain M21) TaxID=443144 RepID=RL9_GEOSM|nr:RecName: Full=Large ribosomal subunit protein bL9; AltName: Full=50S ribosomal protein L9 [Geobacter sp. M21]